MAIVRTLEEAWALFTTRVVRGVIEADRSGTVTPSAIEDDELLAAFLRENEGVFEQKLLTAAEESARAGMAGDGFGAVLNTLRGGIDSHGESDGTRGPLDATLSALRPAQGLDLCRRLVWRHGLEEWAELPADFFARRLHRVPGAHEAPAEMRDALAHRTSHTAPPEVLPEPLDGMSPADIEAAVADYVGAPIADLHARLRPGRSSFSGFLSPEERLGEVVWQDARTLRELGVSRRVLAERLAAAIEDAYRRRVELWQKPGASLQERVGPGRPGGAPIEVTIDADAPLTLHVWRRGYLGSQSNPFHTLEVESTSSDFIIANPSRGAEEVLQGSALAPALIRRFCFFEGQVPYRIDPARAARVLGLLA